MDDKEFEQLVAMFTPMLGEAGARELAQSMKDSGVTGIDFSQLGQQFSPEQMAAAQAQMAGFMQMMFSGTSDGEVNWESGKNVAKRQLESEAVITAAQAEQVRQALTVADLWLDSVTDFAPAAGKREAWSRDKWIEATWPGWQRVCEPVAKAITNALSAAMRAQIADLPEEMSGMSEQIDAISSLVGNMSKAACAMQVGYAVGQVAKDAISAADMGLPLLASADAAILPAGVAEFAKDLDVPEDEVRMYLAVREAATERLYARVPWLRGAVLGAVETYSREISVDTAGIEEAVSGIDPTDPQAVQGALNASDMFTTASPAQVAALEKLQTLLAVIEGWVETVTFQACVAQLPHAVALQEMMRRRRISGGSQKVLHELMGLEISPRRAREASQLWQRIGAEVGVSERDALWAHPDLTPRADELDKPDQFLAMRAAQAQMEADIDADLASLLDGTLGYQGDAANSDKDDKDDKPGAQGDSNN